MSRVGSCVACEMGLLDGCCHASMTEGVVCRPVCRGEGKEGKEGQEGGDGEHGVWCVV
jgi:hypothetical protein